MNRNDFIRAIKDNAIDNIMVGEIREVIDMFPYFQSAHLLLLKGLHDNSDIKFDSQLRQSALQISDRAILYYLLNRKKPEKNDSAPDKIITSDLAEATVDVQQVVIETGRNSQELIAEIEKEAETKEEAKNSDFSLHGIPRSLLATEETDADESVNVVYLFDDDEEKQDENVRYMDPSIIISEPVDLLELDLSADNITDTEETPEYEADLAVSGTPSRKQLQNELIDKFILTNPRIEPVRDKSDHPVEDKSKQYTEEKGSFVTETLAKIYINQGYYSKAIDIYEELCLKFPEKSSYFAAQIEKIKEFIKY
jgi:hypothetical protein